MTVPERSGPARVGRAGALAGTEPAPEAGERLPGRPGGEILRHASPVGRAVRPSGELLLAGRLAAETL